MLTGTDVPLLTQPKIYTV